MGDRIVYTIKQDSELSVNLYSHWGAMIDLKPWRRQFVQRSQGGMTHHMRLVSLFPN